MVCASPRELRSVTVWRGSIVATWQRIRRNGQLKHCVQRIAVECRPSGGRPLVERRARLPKLLDGSGLLASEALPGTSVAIVEAVRGLGLEGVIAKRKDSVYEPGERSDAWQKPKLENQQEFVIVFGSARARRADGFGGVETWGSGCLVRVRFRPRLV
jgi:hypothetical protein